MTELCGRVSVYGVWWYLWDYCQLLEMGFHSIPLHSHYQSQELDNSQESIIWVFVLTPTIPCVPCGLSGDQWQWGKPLKMIDSWSDPAWLNMTTESFNLAIIIKIQAKVRIYQATLINSFNSDLDEFIIVTLALEASALGQFWSEEHETFFLASRVVSLGMKLTAGFQGFFLDHILGRKSPNKQNFSNRGPKGGPNFFSGLLWFCGEILTYLDPKSISLALRMVTFSFGHK